MGATHITPGLCGNRQGPGSLSFIVATVLFLGGCEQPAPPEEMPVKSVKTITVDAPAGERIRYFSGRVAASSSALLSFPVSGTVERIAVNAGDRVKRGQLLASIDARSLALEVESAKADLRKAQALLTQSSNTLRRNEELRKSGFVGEAAVEQSVADVAAARSDVAFRKSRLDKAVVALGDARLEAPFAGVIGERFVQPNEEVAAGAPVLSLLGEDKLDVEVSVPEIAIAGFAAGMQAIVTFSALPDQRFRGKVREIGRVAGAGNVYPVKIALETAPRKLRAGMTAEVALVAKDVAGRENGFRVPVSALRPGDTPEQGHVFVFDDAAGVAREIPVRVVSVRENDVVISGVEAGDVVIVAGVAFLSDGQRVRRMTSPPR